MANFFDQYLKTPNFNPADPIKAQERQFERRRQAARQLIEQSMRQNPSEMVGGGGGNGKWHARPGILVPGNTLGSAIAQGVSGYMAGRENQAIDKAEMDAARAREAQHREWLARQPGASVGIPHVPATEPPQDNTVRNNLDMLLGDEGKAAYDAANNEAAMLGAFNNQPGKPNGGSASGSTSYTNPQGDLRSEVDAQIARNQQLLDNPSDEDRAYMHPTLTATAPSDVAMPQQGGTEPPQGMNDRDQLRWLLEGAMIEAPGAGALLNQAGNNLLTGEARREAAQALAEQRYQQQFELQAQRLAQQADLAASRATSQAELAKIKQDYAIKLKEMDLSFRAAMHNDKMAFNREKVATGAAAAGKPVKTTESERTSAGFLNRMQSAENQFAELESKYGDEIYPTETFGAMGKLPIVGDYAQRKLGSDAKNLYKQAADDWIRAKLRKESGAVIGEQEMIDEYRTYFPQPGDSAAVRAQKARSRKQAEQQLGLSAGGARSQVTPAAGNVPGATGPKKGDTHTNSKGVTFVHDGKGWVRQ